MPTETETLRLAIDARSAVTGAAATTAAVTTMTGATRAAGGMFASLTAHMKSFLTVAAGLAAIRSSVRLFSDFEFTMAQVGAVSSATADEFDMLKTSARDMGAQTMFSANEAAQGLLFLARAGFTSNQAVEALPATLNLATAGVLSLGEAADIASNIVAQFGLEVEDLGTVVDVLTKTANSSNTDIRQLAAAMKFVGPVAGALGLEIEEVSAAIGVLGNSGIQASLAGTNLRGMLSALLAPTGAATTALNEMGISIADLNPESNTLIEIFERLGQANLSAAEAVAIFGRRNAASALILSSNVEALRSLDLANQNAAGTAQELADAMNNTLRGAAKSLISVVQELALQAVEKSLVTALRSTTALLTDLGRVFAGMESAVEGNVERVTLLANTIKFAATATAAYVTLLVSMRAAILGARLAVIALNFAMAANPIGIVLVSLSALIALLVQFRKETFEVKGEVVSIQALAVATFEVLTDLGKRYFTGVTELWTSIFEMVKAFGGAILEYLSDTFLGDIFRWIASLGVTWNDVWEGIKEVAGAALVFVLSVFTSLEERVTAILDRLLSGLANLIEAFSALGRGDLNVAIDFFKAAGGALNPVDAVNEQLDLLTGDFAENEELLKKILGDPREAVEVFSDDLIQSVARVSPTLATVLDDLIGGDFIDDIITRAAELEAQYQQAGNTGTGAFMRMAEAAMRLTENVEQSGLSALDAATAIDQVSEAQQDNLDNLKRRLDAILAVQQRIAGIKFETQLVGLPDDAANIARAVRSANADLVDAGVNPFTRVELLGELSSSLDLLHRRQEALRLEEEQMRRIARAADAFGNAFADNFTDAITGAQSLNDALKSLGQTILSLVIRQTVAQPIASAISGGLQGSSIFGSIFGSAHGNVFQGGRVVPFANGGVINGPIMFPLSNGTGLAGEAGPEAIVPLQRDPNTGNLGVASSGSGDTNITMVFPYTDADSFRRSMPQTMEAVGRLGRRVPRGRQ